MMNIKKNRLFILLFSWILSLIFLFYIVEQEKPESQKFSFFDLFYQPITTQQHTPLMPELQLPALEQAKETAPPLLPNGKKAGSGYIGKATIEYNKNGNVRIILPYKGILHNYYAFNYVNNNVRALILRFPGAWEDVVYKKLLDKGYCVRVIQMGKHVNEVRVSIRTPYGIDTIEEEVRYTDSEIIINVRQAQKKVKNTL